MIRQRSSPLVITCFPSLFLPLSLLSRLQTGLFSLHTIFIPFMSAAGRHKTFMAPFHTLISCDIPFVLFRLDFEHDMSHCILRRVSVRFVASEYFSLADAPPPPTSDNCFSTGSFLLILFCALFYLL